MRQGLSGKAFVYREQCIPAPQKPKSRTGEMAQGRDAITTSPDGPSFIPTPHTVGAENSLL